MAILILLIAVNPPGLIAEITAVAFALAGNTLFPVFLLGIWWDRTNKHGVIAGMTVGIIVTFIPVLFGHLLPEIVRTLLPATSSALIGAPLVLLVIILVSLVTPPPSESVRRFLVENVHSP